jgi:hypothetical protein
MKRKEIDYDSIVGMNVASDYSKGPGYDKEELQRFKFILVVSPVLPFLAGLFRAAEWTLSLRAIHEVALYIGYSAVVFGGFFASVFCVQYFVGLIGTFMSWRRTGRWTWPRLDELF